ncbi:hypothetical protein AK830_g12272, partial [Neonectria ditissima]
SPLEAGTSILDAHHLPPNLLPALEWTSSRLARKSLHVTLFVARRDYQFPSVLPPLGSPGLSPPTTPHTPRLRFHFTAGPVSEDDLLHWECLIQGPEGTPFEGGVFPAELKFPKDYPLAPPSMKFLADVWHPNVYPSGLVCISILHPPGDDPNHYEHASERWSPIQSVEKILISVMSMLAEPNDESPANVEAAKMWRERRAEYENRVRDGVRRMLGL